jgi:hypothetical protein
MVIHMLDSSNQRIGRLIIILIGMIVVTLYVTPFVVLSVLLF